MNFNTTIITCFQKKFCSIDKILIFFFFFFFLFFFFFFFFFFNSFFLLLILQIDSLSILLPDYFNHSFATSADGTIGFTPLDFYNFSTFKYEKMRRKICFTNRMSLTRNSKNFLIYS